MEGFSRISSGAFNVDTFEIIDISWTNLSVIEDNAFVSTNNFDNNFILKLINNPLLSSYSFTEKSFSNILKPTKLYLGHHYYHRDTLITYLPEKTFLPFLWVSPNNLIGLFGVNLDCNDCRNAWLKNHTMELKRIMRAVRLTTLKPLTCANKRNFDDERNFNDCTLFF